jgi:hypothetical protein
VRLVGADIGGNLDCGSGKFVKPNGYAHSADLVKVTGSVFLNNGFSAEGEVRLLGADIGGDLDCSGGKFMNLAGRALSADDAQVAGNVLLRDGFSAEGEVRLLGADIGGNLEISHAEFAIDSSLIAQGATVKGGFIWRDLGANGKGRLT